MDVRPIGGRLFHVGRADTRTPIVVSFDIATCRPSPWPDYLIPTSEIGGEFIISRSAFDHIMAAEAGIDAFNIPQAEAA